jgi:hypothetical protein
LIKQDLFLFIYLKTEKESGQEQGQEQGQGALT